MQRKKPSLVESAFTPGLKTACSVLALTVCLTAVSAQAADQGARRHARGAYDTVTATYAVVDGDEIDLLARILSVADAYDAMTSPRPYRPAKDVADAQKEISSLRTTQFDSRVADAFCDTVASRS